jgi:hypothetical protein
LNAPAKSTLRLCALLLLASVAICSAGEKTVKLLCIGNSFSNNATAFLPDIVKAAGNTLVLRSASIGGGQLGQHWGRVENAEKGKPDEKELYNGKTLKQILEAETFDFVTIQQYSMMSHDVATYRPYAKNLYDYVKKYQPKAEIVMHQTWTYRVDDPRFKKDPAKPAKPGEPETQQAMYEGLTKAYDTIAGELGVRIIPSGDAFHMADSDPEWGFKPDPNFDPKKIEFPTPVNERHSLNMGHYWNNSKDGKHSIGYDGHHASIAGEYLGACCFYETLYGESVVGNKFVPKGITPEDAKYLQETAHKAVETRKAKK